MTLGDQIKNILKTWKDINKYGIYTYAYIYVHEITY